MRPQLTPSQAEAFRRDEVLRYTGTAGHERIDPWSPQAIDRDGLRPDLVVGQGGDCPTLQAALDRVVRERFGRRAVIGVAPGSHSGLAYVPQAAGPVTIVGLGRTPRDAVLHDCIDAEMPGVEYASTFGAMFARSSDPVVDMFRRIAAMEKITTANASVLRVEGDDFQLVNVTVRNDYGATRDQPGAGEKTAAGQYRRGQHQAVALLVAGADRVQVQDTVLQSFQDTLYLQSPAKGQTVRSSFTGCDIEGDVDFIFGQSTAWFERCTIRSLGCRAAQSWATAPSTDIRTPYGFVFETCDFVHDDTPTARAGTFSLGRQWFEGVRATPFGTSPVESYRCELGPVSAYEPPEGTISLATLNSVGKCVVLRSRIGTHVDTDRVWDDWSGRTWNPRHRPALFTASDMFRRLGDWLNAQAIGYDDVDPNAVFLAEFENTPAT